NVARQCAQDADEVEAAVAWHQPLGARLMQQPLDVRWPLGRSVTELRVAQPLLRDVPDFVGFASAPVEMNRVDEDSAVGARCRGNHASALRKALDVGPRHGLEIGGDTELIRQVAKSAKAID